MKKLHKTQQAVLDLLKENIEEPLTVRELQELVGASSPSVVHHHIGQLEKKGYLRRNPNNPQDYHDDPRLSASATTALILAIKYKSLRVTGAKPVQPGTSKVAPPTEAKRLASGPD